MKYPDGSENASEWKLAGRIIVSIIISVNNIVFIISWVMTQL